MDSFLFSFGFAAFFVLIVIVKSVRVVNEYERGVLFRLGRVDPANLKGPGLRLIWPFIDRMVQVDLRTVTHDVPPQEVITKDNVTIKVNAVVYFNVMNPIDAVIKIANHYVATSLYAQTTLRNILGQHELDEILAEREKIGSLSAEDHRRGDRRLGHQGERGRDQGHRAAGGDAPRDGAPGRSRARAPREDHRRRRRVSVVAEAPRSGQVLAQTPSAMQLRYLQTLVEIGVENSTTVVFPLPIELTSAFKGMLDRRAEAAQRRPRHFATAAGIVLARSGVAGPSSSAAVPPVARPATPPSPSGAPAAPPVRRSCRAVLRLVLRSAPAAFRRSRSAAPGAGLPPSRLARLSAGRRSAAFSPP